MPLYAFTIALSAFLLFLVQPIVARQILPWFGGSAAVWTTCMMSFQVALLAGYAYSDLVARRLDARRQRLLHAALLVASLAFMPIVVGEAWRPPDPDRPVLRIVMLLGVTIGLPYFMLSTTGPLLQAWFARSYPRARVYRLYALSNAASLAALVAYPPLIEPSASVPAQAIGWSAGYALFVVLGLALLWRGAAAAAVSVPPHDDCPAAVPSEPPPSKRAPADGRARDQLAWFGLSALGSVLLLAVTAHLTQNVASVPFLWLLPLTLYLLTFILCFDGRAWYRPRLTPVLAGLACALMAAGLIGRVGPGLGVSLGGLPLEQGVFVYAGGLFLLCMFLHGQLAEHRPASARLTRFYLMVALGGAAGGVSVAVVAGLVFDDYRELPLALAAVAVALLMVARSERGRLFAFVVLLVTLTCGGLHALSGSSRLETARNFYGVLSVRALDAGMPHARLILSHGNTVHGGQLQDPDRAREPTAYYGRDSGVARALAWLQHADRDRPHEVGVIGLGVGTLATYRRAGDVYRFYELDPAIVELARRRFSFLSGEWEGIEVRLGDGRLALEREAPNGFRLLVVDAFSSDSIPMHLLTVEAMRLYRSHVDDDGAIAFNVSNRYLDLQPVVRHLADAVGWRALRVFDEPGKSAPWLHPSEWILVTGNPDLADALVAQGAEFLGVDARVAPWTDRHGNLFDVLRALR